MSAGDVVLAVVAVGIAVRMGIGLRRIGRGVGAARREAEVWREARRGRGPGDGRPSAAGGGRRPE